MTNRQTVLIAGATGNIGGGGALALAKRGAHVVLLGRKPDTLQARADAISAELSDLGIDQGDSAIDTLAFDFSDMESVRHGADEALDRFPTIDTLVLSAVALIQNGPNILPSGHELMFATNVMGPFLFTQLLLDRLELSDGLILHVIASHNKAIVWQDLESIEDHKTGHAYNRTKTMNRAMAAELARRAAGRVSSVAFNPTFTIDKDDPELAKRWPKGFMGLFWSGMTALFAKPPGIAGEAMADVILSDRDWQDINGALIKLDKVKKPDKTMRDEELGRRLWDELVVMTGLAPSLKQAG